MKIIKSDRALAGQRSKIAVIRGGTASDQYPLTPEEEKRWKECLATVREGAAVFVRVGQALKTIRIERLYRDEYSEFGQFCLQELGQSKTHVNRTIQAAEIYEIIKEKAPIGAIPAAKDAEWELLLPTNEAQIRPLTRLKSEEEQVEAWRNAVARAQGKGVTAKHVQEAVESIHPEWKRSKTPDCDSTSTESGGLPEHSVDDYREKFDNLLDTLRVAHSEKDWTKIEKLIEELEDFHEPESTQLEEKPRSTPPNSEAKSTGRLQPQVDPKSLMPLPPSPAPTGEVDAEAVDLTPDQLGPRPSTRAKRPVPLPHRSS